MKFHSDSYRDVQTVAFAGTTFSFAAVDGDSSGYGICYTFIETQGDQDGDAGDGTGSDKNKDMDRDTGSGDGKAASAQVDDPPAQSWTVPVALDFPTEVRPVGMALLTEPVFDPDTGAPATSQVLASTAPFTLVVDNIYLWVFRIGSGLHSILADRFIFDATARQLVKANEVRFVHSGHADLPSNAKDRYGSTDPIGDAFVEPTFRLTLDAALDSEPCAVLLVPNTRKSRSGRWHIFVRQRGEAYLLHYEIPYTPRAWFDLSELETPVNDYLEIYHTSRVQSDDYDLNYPTAILYDQQEMAFTSAGEAQMVQRALRALLVCQATPNAGGNPTFAVLDMALGLDGSMAVVPEPVALPPIDAYQTSLAFDGRGDSVEMNGSLGLPSNEAVFLSAWVRWAGPNDNGDPQSVVSLYNSGVSPAQVFALRIDGDGRPHFTCGNQGVRAGAALVPGQWANLAVSFSAQEGNCQIWINGAQALPVQASALSGSLSGRFGLALGKTPKNTSGDWKHYFAGEMGQFYLSTGAEQSGSFLPMNWVYAASPRNRNLGGSTPVLFWSFGEGEGNALANENTALSPNRGNILGATWVRAVCPDQSTMPVVAIDEQSRDIRAALLDPADSGSPAPQPGSGLRPSLMRSADGLVHLYFQDTVNRACALHMTTDTQRARYALIQDLDIDGDGTTEAVNVVTLVARRAGALWGQVAVSLGDVSNGHFSQVTFESTPFPWMNETWNNVPARLDLFAQVINGKAAQPQAGGNSAVTAGAVEAALGQVQYDYTNNLQIHDLAGFGVRPDGPQPSRLFEAIVPETLLVRTPVPDLGGADSVTQNIGAGNDPGWIRVPIQPALKLSGTTGANGRAEGAPALDIDGDLTLQCWIHFNDDDAGTILNYVGDAASYALKLDSSGRVTAKRSGFDSADMTGISRSTAAGLPGDKWAHLAAVYKSSYALHLLPGVYVECKGTSDFDLPDAFTLESWVKFDAGLVGRSAVLSRDTFEEGGAAFELSIYSYSSHSRRLLQLEVDLADGGSERYGSPFTCAPDTWVHLAAAFRSDTSYNYLEFQDDDDNFVELGQPTLEPLSTFTAELYVRVRDGEKQSFVSYDRTSTGGPNSSRNYFQVGYLDNDGPLSVEIENQQIDISTQSWDPQTNEWRALSVVVETEEVSALTATYVSVYVDGSPALLADNSTPAIRVQASEPLTPGEDTFCPWALGMEWDGSGHSDHADMDVMEFRLWSVARSESDILSTFRAPLIGDEPGLVRYVVFDSKPGAGARSVADQVSGDTFPIHVKQDDRTIRWHTRDLGGKMELFVNGQSIGSTSVKGPNNTLAQTSTHLVMGRRSRVAPGSDLCELAGSLDEVRIWNCYRATCQIDYFRQNSIPNLEKQPNLVAYWKFDRPGGSTVEDVVGGHTGKIEGMEFARTPGAGTLWEPSVFGADWTLYIDGASVAMGPRTVLDETPPSPPPASGLNVGCGTQLFSSCITAYLNELQIWERARTHEEIVATRHQPEAPSEGLKGYYRFNDGAGSRASDLSGHGADIDIQFDDTSTDPDNAWVAYDGGSGELSVPAPVRDEALTVINVTNGYAYPEATALAIAGPPSVVDDMASGVRVYTWCSAHDEDAGSLSLAADQPLAGTELVYLGQVQYQPQLVGYIEGAPPVPSENLTIDAPSNPDRYLNNSSTQLSLQSGTSVSVSSDIGVDGGLSRAWLGGWATESKGGSNWGTYQGLPGAGGWFGIGTPSIDSHSNKDLEVELGASGNFGYTQSGSLALSKGQTYSANLDGGWEHMCYQVAGPVANANPFQIAGRRLYRPNNMGSAVVKSRTADLYAVRSSKTKAMLGYRTSVVPEIPEDINIINFKLNPKYVHNGSLDGYIGFDTDQYYGDLSAGKKGSYFKPEQAYRLKRTIDREAERAASDLSQFNPFGGASDYSGQAVTLSLANTYVWTADAGTYAEEQGAASSFSEQFSGGIQLAVNGDYTGKGTVAAGWGFLSGADIGLDIALSGGVKLNYSHTEQESKALNLTSNVNSEGFLYRIASFSNWSEDGLDAENSKTTLNSGVVPECFYAAFAAQGISLTEMNRVDVVSTNQEWTLVDLYVVYRIALSGSEFSFTYVPTGTSNSQYAINYDYGAPPCPGKVRGYRYMSLYLAADKGNFDSLFAEGEDQIIDPDWLAGDDPDAIALRQAGRQKNAVWRLMHRVTYVNRVPPMADEWGTAAPPDTQDVASPPLRPDEHSIHHNATLIQRVIAALPSDSAKEAASELDLHALELADVDMDSVAGALEDVLDQLSITDDEVRKIYMSEMIEFFELLFVPDEKQRA